MAGKPQVKLRNVANLCEWFRELASDFDRLLPGDYRYDGQKPGRDRRHNAWANADRCIITTAAALSELEAVLRERATRPVGDNDAD